MPEAILHTYIKISTSFITAKDLSTAARAIYCRLRCYENRRTGRCNPRVARLALDLNLSERTVKRGLRNLRLTGWIIPHKTMHGNTYEISQNKPVFYFNGGAKNGPCAGATSDPYGGAKSDLAGVPVSLLTELQSIELGNSAAAGVNTTRAEAAAAAPVVDEKPQERERENQHKPTPAPARVEAEKLVLALMPQHPEPGNLPKAVAEAEKVLAKSLAGITATVETLLRNHGLWRARWATYEAKRFIPQLWRWFHDGDWETPPPERKDAQRESWHERHERERKASDEECYRQYAELGMWSALREYGGDELVEVWREKIKVAV